MADPTPSRPLTYKEVAHRLNVSQRAVRRLVDDGDLPQPFYVGGTAPRFWEADVNYYLWQLQQGKKGQKAKEEEGKGKK